MGLVRVLDISKKKKKIECSGWSTIKYFYISISYKNSDMSIMDVFRPFSWQLYMKNGKPKSELQICSFVSKLVSYLI